LFLIIKIKKIIIGEIIMQKNIIVIITNGTELVASFMLRKTGFIKIIK